MFMSKPLRSFAQWNSAFWHRIASNIIMIEIYGTFTPTEHRWIGHSLALTRHALFMCDLDDRAIATALSVRRLLPKNASCTHLLDDDVVSHVDDAMKMRSPARAGRCLALARKGGFGPVTQKMWQSGHVLHIEGASWENTQNILQANVKRWLKASAPRKQARA
jgi:hypothetical protein